MMGTSAVLITGRGVVSPWGTGVPAFAAGIRTRRTAIREMPDSGDRALHAGLVPDFDAGALLPMSRGLREFDRTSLLLAGTTALALADAGLEIAGRTDVGVAVGSTFGTISSIMHFDLDALLEGPLYASPLAFPNTVLNAPTGRVAGVFGIRGVNATISTGETSGLDALVYGTEWLLAGRAACLLAGSGFGLSPALVDGHPDVLGEGAAVFLLEPSRTACAARRYASVAGFSTVFLPRGRDARELAVDAINKAMEEAGIAPRAVDAVVVGGRDPDGEPGLEQAAIQAALGGACPPPCGFREWIGDTLDASGGLEIAAGLLAIEMGARVVLLSAFSRRGHAAFVVLGPPEGQA